MVKKKLSFTAIILFIFTLFILSSIFAEDIVNFFKNIVGEGFLGMIVFIIVIVFEIIFVPLNPVPFIPLATNLWGWKISGTLILIGWTMGSLLAFLIARKSRTYLEKKVSFDKIRKIEKVIPERNVFLGIILLRICAPFDLISYGIGFFSKVDWKVYLFASFIGYAPLAFALAYLGAISIFYQILLLILGFLIIYFFILEYKTDKNLKKKVKKFEKRLNKKFK